MNLKLKIISFVLFVAVLGLFSFKVKNNSFEAIIKIKEATELKNKLELLNLNARAFQKNTIKIDSLQTVYLDCRASFKRIEFLLCFQNPEFINSKINGAPLLDIEKINSNPYLKYPEGFQVLDELIFAEKNEINANEIANHSQKLVSNYNQLFENINAHFFQSKDLIVAIRIQLIRIFTLGITGFDTPGSNNAIPDAINSLKGIKEYLKKYSVLSKENTNLISNELEKTIAFLKPSDFENLNRLEFLKNHLDPLYKKLLPFQENSSLQFATSWNKESQSLFDKSFLNPYFFTHLKKEEDTENLRQLGEKLFYDTILSKNGNMSCASCHQPSKSFTDGLPKSNSSNLKSIVSRNAPTLLNSVYADRFFYDLRAFYLEQQVEHVLFNNLEFNTSYSEILNKLNHSKAYKKAFKSTLQSKNINREQFTKALASYVLSLQSNNSTFDQYVRGELQTINPSVINGFNLFMGKANCASCHFAPTFSGLVPPLYVENETEILGVLQFPKRNELDTDEGRFNNGIDSEKSWIYEKSFKTTTVRNAGETAPYFHHGGYQTLNEVIDFYDQGGGEGVSVATKNQTLPKDKLNLTNTEKKELIQFIESLSNNPYHK